MASEYITREGMDEMTRLRAPQRAHRADGNSSEHQVPRVGNNQQWDSQDVPDLERKETKEERGQSSSASSGPKAECTASGTANTGRTASHQQTRPVYRTARDRAAGGYNSRT